VSQSLIQPVRLSFVLPINEEKSVHRMVFVYLVTGERLALVDTGPLGCEQQIVSALEGMDRSLDELEWVVNTHAHPDHVGGNAYFRDASDAEFACHADAVRWIENLELQHEERPIYSFFTLAGRDPITVSRALEDGDDVDLGDVTLRVVHAPGHSPGSMALFCPEEGVLITGDILAPTGHLPLYADVEQLRHSLRRLSELPGVEAMYASHSAEPIVGDDIPQAFEKSLAYLDDVDSTVHEVVAALPEDASPADITRETLIRLGLEPPPVLPITVTSIMSHLS